MRDEGDGDGDENKIRKRRGHDGRPGGAEEGGGEEGASRPAERREREAVAESWQSEVEAVVTMMRLL